MSSATSSLEPFLVSGPYNEQHSKQGSVVFTSFGVPIAVRVSDPAIIPQLLERVPPGSELSSATPARVYTVRVRRANHCSRRSGESSCATVSAMDVSYDVRVGNRRLARAATLVEALDAFESDLQIHVAEMCDNRVFVHAGVVGWKGKAILLPGPSCSGKTTLVAQLIERGATYYSDEYAVLDSEGRVHPYSRALSTRTNRETVRRKCQPEALGARRGIEPLPLGLVVVTRYQEGMTWTPRELTGGHVILALISNTVSIRRQPQQAIATLCRAAGRIRALESARGEASTTAELLLAELESGSYPQDVRKGPHPVRYKELIYAGNRA